MPLISDQAVCIRHWDYSETSQTVSLFCRDTGLLRGLAKGAKKEKGRFSGGIELLTCGHIQAIAKPGRDIATLTDWDLLELFPYITKNLHAYYAALYFIDLIQYKLTDNDPHSILYDNLINSLRILGKNKIQNQRAILLFHWSLLTETGYQPIIDKDAQTGQKINQNLKTLAFSPEAGGIVTDNGSFDRWRVRTTTINLLQIVAQHSYDNSNYHNVLSSLDNADSQSLNRANRLLAAYIRTIMDRQLNTVKPLFGDLDVK